jgi:hypothetical protein
MPDTVATHQPPVAACSTLADTRPNQNAPGGIWITICTCGWQREGAYARNSGEPVALRLANAFGQRHEQGEDDQDA